MITIDLYRDSFKQNRNAFRETVKSWRVAVEVLDQIQRDDYMAGRLPEDTVRQMVHKTDEGMARFIIASLVNRTAWDGRIYPSVAAWAAGVCDALDEETANAAGLYSKMHPAHLNQIAQAMMEYKPEPEPAEDKAGPALADITAVTVYGHAIDVILEYMPEALVDLSDEMINTLHGFDDYDGFRYFVFNDSLVMVADGMTGATNGPAESIAEFFAGCVEYCRDIV